MRHLIIAGAQRCGSTSLLRMLARHPQIMENSPVSPEPKVFLRESRRIKSRRDYIEALGLMPEEQSGFVTLEKSVSYIENPCAGKEALDTLGEVGFIFILRDPVKRAVSNYFYTRGNGLEDLSFQESLEKEAERIETSVNFKSVSPYAYIERGKYLNYISEYLKLIPWERIYIVILEELLLNTEAQIRRLLSWAGVGDAEFPGNWPMEKLNATVTTSGEFLMLESAVNPAVFEDSTRALEQFLGRSITHWGRG